MRPLQLIIIVVCMFIFFNESTAQRSQFGLGASIGEPTGINSKVWVTPTNAFDFSLGWSVGGDRIGAYDGHYNGSSRMHVHFDYLFHIANAEGLIGQFPVYYGIGGRFNTGGGYYNSLAVRFVTGLEWIPPESQIDIFIEFVPSYQLTSEPGWAIDSSLGVRYYL